MNKKTNKSEQRGTLLVEAIAMLGLIALVTPTLYKKSAERMQEIQDINMASQARTMGAVIETFIKNNQGSILSDLIDTSSNVADVWELCYKDSCAGSTTISGVKAFPTGYSSAIPTGFQPFDLKNYKFPRVLMRNDNGKMIYFIIYPKEVDLGKRRAARMASLVGANGGMVEIKNNKPSVIGTGGSWLLDSSVVQEMKIPATDLTENSLVITSQEPIVVTREDEKQFLYRVPPDDSSDTGGYFRNQMVTDLYMGGENGDETDYNLNAREFHSIFNVRKLTLNTNCNAESLGKTDSSACVPEVADLYVGRPEGYFADDARAIPGGSRKYGPNKGAAWIWGNLSALSDRFKVYNTEYGTDTSSFVRNGVDVMSFVRYSDSEDIETFDRTGASVAVEVFRAENDDMSENGMGAQVAMMDGLVRVVENFPGQSMPAFLIGNPEVDSTGVVENAGFLMRAYGNDTDGTVEINNSQEGGNPITRINNNGGEVYINGRASDDTSDSSAASELANAHTYINHRGGTLQAGPEGGWVTAGGEQSMSSRVQILNGGNGSSGVDTRLFTVGNPNENENHIIYANEESSLVSLRGGAMIAVANVGTRYDSSQTGGATVYENLASGVGNFNGGSSLTDNATLITSRYTDILGSTYMGNAAMEEGVDGLVYSRANWTAGIAGSAWVDDLLFARRAWLHDAGFNDLHAGFSSFAEYSSSPHQGMFNVYGDSSDSTGAKVVIRNRQSTNNSSTQDQMNNVFFWAGQGSADVYDPLTGEHSTAIVPTVALSDTSGAYANMQMGVAEIGNIEGNFVRATSGSTNVVGSSLANIYTADSSTEGVVSVQEGAMQFKGRFGDTYSSNVIEAHASEFSIQTASGSSGTEASSAAQFYADKELIRTRHVNFEVQKSDDGKARFRVAPDEEPEGESSLANVMVDGSFHVTGNRVIHVASNSSNVAGETEDNPHAMFEIDPKYIKVWAKDSVNGSYIGQAGGISPEYQAMLHINPYDVDGTKLSSTENEEGTGGTPLAHASIYIRKGAIELQESPKDSTGVEADAGYGYIKANRFVSNTGLEVLNNDSSAAVPYDTYMVNPAYTSVMHDIKLTTRGGARLSDVLPDYILKGVYNVSNDFLENSDKQRIKWSCGKQCDDGLYTGVSKTTAWADPYVGIIPYAVCPPGYKNLATIVPTSFQMGQAGELIKASSVYTTGTDGFVVNPRPRQAKVLAAAGDEDIIYPEMEKVETLLYNEVTSDVATGEDGFPVGVYSRDAGWFLGVPAIYDTNNLQSGSISKYSTEVQGGVSVWKYAKDGGNAQVLGQPLYFQQNTWLKTSVVPGEYGSIKGWEGRMGFLYNIEWYEKNGKRDAHNSNSDGINSQNAPEGENETTSIPFETEAGVNLVWNLFPVPTNTLEGQATVYCYFDRNSFTGKWKELIDPIDQLSNNFRDPSKAKAVDKDDVKEYLERLDDPSLKYKSPW